MTDYTKHQLALIVADEGLGYAVADYVDAADMVITDDTDGFLTEAWKNAAKTLKFIENELNLHADELEFYDGAPCELM